MKKAEAIGFSKEWANKHTKAEFIEQHKHQKDLVKDLGKEWEKLQDKPKVDFEVSVGNPAKEIAKPVK